MTAPDVLCATIACLIVAGGGLVWVAQRPHFALRAIEVEEDQQAEGQRGGDPGGQVRPQEGDRVRVRDHAVHRGHRVLEHLGEPAAEGFRRDEDAAGLRREFDRRRRTEDRLERVVRRIVGQV